MAVTSVGTNTTAQSDTTGTTLTFSHTIPSGATMLVVSIGASDWSGNPSVSSITWNTSENLSAVANTLANPTIDSAYATMQHWVLHNPTATTGSVVITFAASTYQRWAVAHAYSGTATSSGTEGGATASGTSGTSLNQAPSTTTVADTVLIGSYWYSANDPDNIATVDTQLYESYSGILGGVWNVASDVVTGSGETVGWTMTSGVSYGASVFVIKSGVTGTVIATTVGNTVAAGVKTTFGRSMATTVGNTVAVGITSSPVPSSWTWTTLTSVNSTAAYRIESTPDLSIGNIIAHDNKSGVVTMYQDGLWAMSQYEASFGVMVYTVADRWSDRALQTINEVADIDCIVGNCVANGVSGYFSLPMDCYVANVTARGISMSLVMPGNDRPNHHDGTVGEGQRKRHAGACNAGGRKGSSNAFVPGSRK